MSDAALQQKNDQVLLSMERDAGQFAEYNYSPDKIKRMQIVAKAFNELPSDEFLEGERQNRTEDKNEARAQLIKQTRKILMMAENKYGKASGYYKQFGKKSLTKLRDEDLVRNTTTVVLAAKKYYDQLAEEGLTEKDIKLLDKLDDQLDDAIDRQQEAETTRNSGTLERIIKGNKLYLLLVKACNTGKYIWDGEDPVKYDDYVLYEPNSNGEMVEVSEEEEEVLD